MYNKFNLSQKKGQLLFFLLILFTVGMANSWKVFNYPPRSVHQWRQSDCAAYVKTYYRTGADLLQPATYNLAGKQGRVISEFPVIYYISAQIERLTGEHYWVTRTLTFICYLLGLSALLACCRQWISDTVFALFPVVLLATSPYYYYYAINFLPNIPAISFSFIGLYYFIRWEERSRLLPLILGTLFFVLATALKPTDGGIVWLAYAGTRISQFLFTGGQQKKSKKEILPLLISFLIIGFSILAWTRYVNWYNDQNENHQNLIGIYPIWSMDRDLMMYTAKRVVTEWSNVFQHRLVLIFTILLLPVYIWKWKQLHSFLRIFTLLTGIGTICYCILWFKAFTDHDYYQLPFVLPGVFLMITIAEYVTRILKPRLSRPVLLLSYSFCGLLALISIYHNRNIQQERYTRTDYVYLNPAIYEVEPYLRKIGVSPTDAVVCVPDRSPNITLNAINNYGYTEEFNNDYYNIHTFKKLGASFLIVSDSSYLENPLYKPFLKNKIGYYKGIYIFDMR